MCKSEADILTDYMKHNYMLSEEINDIRLRLYVRDTVGFNVYYLKIRLKEFWKMLKKGI